MGEYEQMSLSEDIKDFALDLGYSKVGITSADSFPIYTSELKTRCDQYRFHIESRFKPLDWADPRTVMPSAKSIIATVFDYSKEAFPEKLLGKIGRLYQARCYLSPEYRINGAREKLMEDFLVKNGCQVTQSRGVPKRLSGARAGITTYGKNTFAFADTIGSFIMINTFVVDVELEYDEPTMKVNCPEGCTACIDACPTGALYEPLKMNPVRCIAFNTFATRDGRRYTSSQIPPDIREKMNSWIHGCDICQEVCPRNQKRLKAKLPFNDYLVKKAEEFELTKILNLTDEYYQKVVHPLMYNYIRDKKYFQRNAAIALGNTRDSTFVTDLAKAMEDSEDLVRAYAAWALGRIGGKKARSILEVSLSHEKVEFVKNEIESALNIV